MPTPETPMWFAIDKRGVLVRGARGDGFRLPTVAELAALGIGVEGAHLVGTHGEGESASDVHAVSLPDDLPLPEGWSMLGIRELVNAFDEETFALAGRAAHVIDWATTSRFCGRCGTPTVRLETERCMKCPACALTMYPRIAPAIIVLVRRGEQALLARNARFPIPFFSTLAGFSDIGESLEETVVREVFEEVGVRVRSIRYFGSQPWPFPHSLMLGFTAEWESGEIRVDGEEIAEAGWYSADALPLVPPAISISRKLIDAWIAEVR